MKVLKTIFFICLLYNVTYILAQETDTVTKDRDMIDVPAFQNYNPANNNENVKEDKTMVNIEMGTSFTTIGGNSFMSYYTMPSVTYRINPKFDLTTGVLINRSSYPYLKLNSEEEVEVSYSPATDIIVFSNGIYRYNNKLTITAGAYKSLNDVPPREKQFSATSYNNNIQGMSLGINYNVSENFRIGFEFNYSEGMGLYNTNPYYYTPGFRYYPYFGF